MDANNIIGERFVFKKSKLIPSSGTYEVVRLYNPCDPTESCSHAVCAKVLKNGEISFKQKDRIGIPLGWLKKNVDE